MSEQQPEDDGSITLAGSGDGAFAALMDALAPEQDAAPDSPDAAAGPADSDSDGPDAAPAEGAAGAGDTPEPAPGGAAGDRAVPSDGGTTAPATPERAGRFVGAVDYKEIQSAFGEITEALEELTLDGYRSDALDQLKEEYPRYIEALGKHPRLLVGTEVPAIGKEGTEVLRDAADAQEWQEAVKSVLSQEVESRAEALVTENSGSLEVLHSSIALFQNNGDLVPGTKQFDGALADAFAKAAKPYEVRVDGKLRGYQIPVQPLIDQIREEQKAAKAAAPAAPAPAKPAAPKAAPKPLEPPQAGITSKAGTSSEAEDYSVLFGTLGNSGFRI